MEKTIERKKLTDDYIIKAINENYGLIVNDVKKFMTQYSIDNSNFDDIFQQAIIGFINGLKKFNPEKYDNKIYTFVGYYVKHELQKYLRMITLIPVSYKVRKYSRDKIKNNQDINAELANIIYNQNIIYLSDKANNSDDDSKTYLDVIPDNKAINIEEDIIDDEIKQALLDIINIPNILTEKEKECILLYYGFKDDKNYTLEEIGKLYGISRERVRQIIQRGLRKMKTAILKNKKYRDLFINDN